MALTKVPTGGLADPLGSIATSGNLTLDVAGHIELNADDGNVKFADAGVIFGQLQNGSGSQFIMQGLVADQDMFLKVNDGGSTINAITIDASAAAAVTVNSTLSAPGIISSSVGLSHIGEFTANTVLAGNSAAIIQLQNCFSSDFSVYRILGSIGGGHDSEDDSQLRFLSSGTTSIDSGYFWALTGLDDAGTTNAAQGANTNQANWHKNGATTITHKVDMHIYFGGGSGGIQWLGRASYHDQGSDRGFIDFGGNCSAAQSATGIEFFVDDGGNMSTTNFTVYGYRTTQQASSKMVGSYTT